NWAAMLLEVSGTFAPIRFLMAIGPTRIVAIKFLRPCRALGRAISVLKHSSRERPRILNMAIELARTVLRSLKIILFFDRGVRLILCLDIACFGLVRRVFE